MALHVGTVGPPLRAISTETEVLRQIIDAVTSRAGLVGANDLGVTQAGTPAMSVVVAAGFAIVAGTHSPPAQGDYIVYNDAPVTLTIAASTSQPRVDVVELKVQDSYYGVAGDTAALAVVTGTPGASPLVPAADADAIVLAHVYVPASAVTIVNANINSTAGTNNPDAAAAYAAPLAVALRGDLGWYHAAGAAASGFTAEQVTATVTIPDPGVPYRVKLSAMTIAGSTVATDTITAAIRDTNLAGAVLKSANSGQGSQIAIPQFKYDVNPNTAKTFVLTLRRNAGTGTLTSFSNDATTYIDAEVIPL